MWKLNNRCKLYNLQSISTLSKACLINKPFVFFMGIREFIGNVEKNKTKNDKVSEHDIEEHFRKYATKRGALAAKLIFLHKRGFPDRTVLYNGRVIFIEFKVKGGKLSGAQKVVKRLLEDLNFEYYVCDEIGQAEQILDDFIKRLKHE